MNGIIIVNNSKNNSNMRTIDSPSVLLPRRKKSPTITITMITVATSKCYWVVIIHKGNRVAVAQSSRFMITVDSVYIFGYTKQTSAKTKIANNNKNNTATKCCENQRNDNATVAAKAVVIQQ